MNDASEPDEPSDLHCEHGRDPFTCPRCAAIDGCGCCGRLEITSPDGYWCRDCRQHVAPTGHPWNRTFFAQHGTDCPFQIQ